ncbi:MAG: PHB depolymerase family esterase [Steroidobacteraceae bacterium]
MKGNSRITWAFTLIALLGASSAATAADCVPGVREITFSSGGRNTRADLVLPPSFRAGQRVPLVIGLHPSGGSGRSFDDDTGLTARAGHKHFAVLLADGALQTGDGSGHFWNIPGVPLVSGATVPPGTRDDIRFIGDAIDEVVKNHCIDPKRVSVTGFSGGARMSSMVACRLADRVAAIAPVAGLRAGRAGGLEFAEPDPADCTPWKPVRVLAIHGTDDRTNPYAGGGGVRWGYSVERAAARWASLDGCDSAPRSDTVSAHVTRIRYGACSDASAVELYRIDASEAEGGGHVWPGGKRAPKAELNATELVLEFFARP